AGELSIQTDPPGAALFLDGEARGETPARVANAAGKHRVVLLLDGRTMYRQTVDVPASGRALLIALPLAAAPPRGTAGVKVRCRTAGLRVLIDDIDSGQSCPTERIDLEPGEHTIKLYLPERDSFSEKTEDI